MKKILFLSLIVILTFVGCKADLAKNKRDSKVDRDRDIMKEGASNVEESREPNNQTKKSPSMEERSDSKAKKPKTVRDFFLRLPGDFFTVEGCSIAVDKDCQEAKKKYLRKYLAVEDTKNGYMESGGDGAQSTFKMAIFRRSNGGYVVGLNVLGEMENSFRFLEFEDGKWLDVSLEEIPEYSKTNIYELPRFGKKIKVFAKRIVEQRDGFEVSEKGEKLYELVWEDDEFAKIQ